MLSALKKATLPPPPHFFALLGPSFILLGLGMGSGELILWPHLAANWGLGIIWGAVLGITLQFFMNMEIERYALVTGESIFVGFARKFRFLPLWFIVSTLLPWMWPGIIGSSAFLVAHLTGLDTKLLSIFMLVLVGVLLTLGPVLYKTEEVLQRTIIILGVPFIFVLTLILAKGSDWVSLAQGLIGNGDGYWFLPVGPDLIGVGISLASFLGAFAYAGAGGNLNLAQSFYVKEKGYGMGRYSGRITSILTGPPAGEAGKKVELEGTTFEANEENVSRFRKWWKMINIEHLAVFWFTGAFGMLLLSLLAYSTVFGLSATGLNFLIAEAGVISLKTLPIIGTFFLGVAALMLFSTQVGVFDTTSRILTENLSLLSKKYFPTTQIPRNFYLFLWLQILLGVIIFALDFAEPLTLVIIGAVLNAFAMFVHVGLTLWLNLTSLEKPLRPSLLRIGAMAVAFLFLGGFSLFTLINYL